MALPRWLARFNRRFLNTAVVERGRWPVLVHTGRNSGHTHRTPLDAFPVDGGYMFTVNYGTKSDWPKNVLAAQEAQLELHGETIPLADPRLLPVDEAYRLLPDDAKRPPSFVGVEQCLLMTTAG